MHSVARERVTMIINFTVAPALAYTRTWRRREWQTQIHTTPYRETLRCALPIYVAF